MTKQLDAIYDSGVLRPLEPLPFADQQRLHVTVTDETGDKKAFDRRDREFLWLDRHSGDYAGEWVALDGERLLAHGIDGRAVTQQAWEQGVKDPFVAKVPDAAELPFGGW